MLDYRVIQLLYLQNLHYISTFSMDLHSQLIHYIPEAAPYGVYIILSKCTLMFSAVCVIG